MKAFLLEDEIHFAPRNLILEALLGHNLTIAKSVGEAKRLYSPSYDLLLLDHDMEGHFELSSHPNTGFQFVKWLVYNHNYPKAPVILNSQNPTGRGNMRGLLLRHKWEVEEHPFSMGYVNLLDARYGAGRHKAV